MKKKIIRVVMILGGIVVITTSCVYLLLGKSIPGLAPLSLAVVMFSIPYSSYHNYIEGKTKKISWQAALWGGTIAGILNVIAGMFQIFVALRK